MRLSRRQKIVASTMITLVTLGGGTSYFLVARGSDQKGHLIQGAGERKQSQVASQESLSASGSKIFAPLPEPIAEIPSSLIWGEDQAQIVEEALDLKRKVFLEPEEERKLERFFESELEKFRVYLKIPSASANVQQAQEDLVELLIADMEKNLDVRLALTLVNDADLSGSGSEPEVHLAGLVGELLFHALAFDPEQVQSWARQNHNPIKAKIFENTQRLAQRNLQESQSDL